PPSSGRRRRSPRSSTPSGVLRRLNAEGRFDKVGNSRSRGGPMSVQSIGIIGSGLMGRGIAEVTTLAGLRATLVKATTGAADGLRSAVAGSLDRAVKKGKLEAERRDAALGRLTCTTDRDALSGCDLVVESVV